MKLSEVYAQAPNAILDPNMLIADCPICEGRHGGMLYLEDDALTFTAVCGCPRETVLALLGVTEAELPELEIDLDEFLPAREDEENEDADDVDRYSLDDAHLGARVAADHLRGKFLAWGRTAWSRWDGRRWEDSTDTAVFDAVRRALIQIHTDETQRANKKHDQATKELADRDDVADEDRRSEQAVIDKKRDDRQKKLRQLFAVSKMTAVQRVARGVLEIRQEEFDSRPDLLNCGNGVVDLRDGSMQPHDPSLMFTKVTETDYYPDARHPDWDKALTALPADAVEWMQLRFGQAATGYAAPDGIVPFLRGGGENGKSSILDGITGALGRFAVLVPDKVLVGNPGDHPTEKMTLKGARFAYIEELPEGKYLDVQTLKKISDTREITARHIGQDNVTWTATHSMFVTTNYPTNVNAVDHGTWRRLALVMFPYKYDGSDPERPKDPTLKLRIQEGRDGQHEAALAWLVEGAKRWYAADRTLPPRPESVKRDTDAWQHDANQAVRFMNEMYEPAEGHAVLSAHVFSDFKEWATAHNIPQWLDQTFWDRAKAHPWFRDGVAEKTANAVSTAQTRVHGCDKGTKPPRAKLVRGIKPIGAPDVRPSAGLAVADSAYDSNSE